MPPRDCNNSTPWQANEYEFKMDVKGRKIASASCEITSGERTEKQMEFLKDDAGNIMVDVDDKPLQVKETSTSNHNHTLCTIVGFQFVETALNKLAYDLSSSDTQEDQDKVIEDVKKDLVNASNELYLFEHNHNDILKTYCDVINQQKRMILDYKEKLRVAYEREDSTKLLLKTFFGGQDLKGLEDEIVNLKTLMNNMCAVLGWDNLKYNHNNLYQDLQDMKSRLTTTECGVTPETNMLRTRVDIVEQRIREIDVLLKG